MKLIKISSIFVFLVFFITIGCSSDDNSPEIQVRKEINDFKTIGKVTFKNTAYRGVYQVNLNDDISLERVKTIADEITGKYNIALVKPAFPELKNPSDRIFWIEKVSDDTILEIGKDERIKFITQYFTSH